MTSLPTVYSSAEELIGKTPLLELKRIEKNEGLRARLLAKLECFNPAGSAKDRVARAMLDYAESSGEIQSGSVIIEATSGNTGIGLASVGAARGYRTIIVMPETMSEERQRLLRAYGAELVLTDGSLGMKGAIAKAEELAQAIDKSFMARQFDNPANSMAHKLTTGPEIFQDTDGEVDIFVAGIGTGGTVSGVGEYLKEKKPSVRIVGVEPKGSPVLTEGRSGAHGLQGIGAGFVPKILNTEIIDEVLTVSEDDAFARVRDMGRCEGVLVGISSGAALHAAIEIAKRAENEGKTIVVLLPDTGERYLSTSIFD